MQDAAERLNRWTAGQFLDPLFTGQWTPERQQMVPSFILPRFTPAQSAALKAAKVGMALGDMVFPQVGWHLECLGAGWAGGSREAREVVKYRT